MFMRKFIKKQVSLSLVTVLMLVIVIFGSSYALFQESYSDLNTQTISVGDLGVAFLNASNGTLSDNDAINLANLTPMTDATALTQNNNVYSFVVSNSGTVSYCYTIKLEDNPNYTTNLLNHQYIRLKVNDERPMMLSDTLNGIITNYTIDPGEALTYQVRVWVADAETYLLPNETIGQEVHLNIKVEGEACSRRGPKHYYDAEAGTLVAGIRDNQTTTQKTYTIPGEQVSTTDEGLRETFDDYGISYYYRGAVPNNFVVFANMCWRIVRIDGQGNTKLILYNYNPTGAANPCASSLDGPTMAFARYDNTTSGQSGLSKFNENSNKNTYVGFMYSTVPDSSNVTLAHANDIDSTILTNLKTWYDKVFTADNKAKLADTIWCNDKRIVTDTTYNGWNINGTIAGTGLGAGITYYQSTKRLLPTSTATPSLKCGNSISDNIVSKFTASSSTDGGYGNGALGGYKIGLITADEMAFAGGTAGASDASYYLYKNANDGSNWYWVLSPGVFTGTNACVWDTYDSVNLERGVRPAISLKYNTKITGGTGIQSDPFIVQE